jgi:hypothetical protein
MDKIEQDINEMQDLQILDQINELEDKSGPITPRKVVKPYNLSIEPSAIFKKNLKGPNHTDARLWSKEGPTRNWPMIN